MHQRRGRASLTRISTSRTVMVCLPFSTSNNSKNCAFHSAGEFLTGEVGTDTVTVGGLTVAKQEIGLVTNAAWTGDGVNTGLMGLAYPDLTSVFNGTNPDNDTPAVRDRYNPFFWTAVAEKVVTNPCKSYLTGRSKSLHNYGSYRFQCRSEQRIPRRTRKLHRGPQPRLSRIRWHSLGQHRKYLRHHPHPRLLCLHQLSQTVPLLYRRR